MKNKLILMSSLLYLHQALASGTVVGNGGDPIFYFLESTRFSLMETLRVLLVDTAAQKDFCSIERLSQEQRDFCREFGIEISKSVLGLDNSSQPVPFVLREEALFVTGPDGKPMSVAARTESGPTGPIEFHRPSINTMAPTQVLFLMAHEFQHKAIYRGGYVGDNEARGPFATSRELLDSVATAVSTLARKKGKIGSQYGLRDSFSCDIAAGTGRFGVRASSPRMFLTESLMSYDTSLGRNPTDAEIFVPETLTTELSFQVAIHEPANCSDDVAQSAGRSTHVTIVRIHKDKNTAPPEVVAEQDLLGQNPICSKDPLALSLTFQNTVFSCVYAGTEGTTSSAIGVNSRPH